MILNDILDLSKIEAGKIELEKVPFEPRTVIGNVRDMLRFKAEEKGLVVGVWTIAYGCARHMLIGDPTRLQPDAPEPGGQCHQVHRAWWRQHPVACAESDGRADQCTLSVDVIDTGIGIPPDRLEKSSTSSRRPTATPRASTVARVSASPSANDLVEMQGGRITVQSEQGKGSTFTVTIPYAIARQCASLSYRSNGQLHNGHILKDLRILLAEDNEFNVMVAQDELADAIPGVHVDVAANGMIAVEMAAGERLRRDPHGRADAGDERLRCHAGDPRTADGKSRIPILAMTANVMKAELERAKMRAWTGSCPSPSRGNSW